MAKKILVADDEPFVLRSIEYTLARAGYNVVTATDGEEAFHKVLAEAPDLVFLDIQMPRMDGNEVCKKLRQDPSRKSLPIIVITAKGQESERLFSLDAVLGLGAPVQMVWGTAATIRTAGDVASFVIGKIE